MAMQETSPAPAPAPAPALAPAPPPAPSAEVVGNAFVQQYYHILHFSPGLVHRFYQDSSLLSRPDAGGLMGTVTTMQAINDKIISLNYGDYTAEIKTADAQESFGQGVIVLVTGCLIGRDNVRKKFSQTFFLARQDRGYFVLNDVFRFVEDTESLPNNSAMVNRIHETTAPPTSFPPEEEPGQSSDHAIVDHPASLEEEDLDNGAEVCDPSDKEEESVTEEDVIEPPVDLAQNVVGSSDDAVPAALEDAPKKSYASIVKVMKGNKPSNPVYVPTNNVRPSSPNSEQQLLNSAKTASVAKAWAPASGIVAESADVSEEAEGHSIFVRNLPYNATTAQLHETFRRFGPIKHGGIQVRSRKQGFCFGFVEFETLSSMLSALEASPISIGDHVAVVEEKRTNTRVSGSGRGRYPSGRSRFRSDSFKSRGISGSGRGYGKNEFRNQAEFSGQARGSGGRDGGGEDHLWSNQNGSKRGGRQGGAKGSYVPA